ncbi:hypothetical protein [Acetobacter cerevisiae]|uniref:hypothetical protein n=1 Tax=Acetobacter cerevisiae TaxID=178900 RepID=UPI00209C9FF1|nr:hypothetical protein [Acetobacter cerevisiae]MCP1271766.1 hypothetical protein [Acetobacter cerevisiae]MCP1279714.1 hypothetical protein [Acetobacter cerevisiae]
MPLNDNILQAGESAVDKKAARLAAYEEEYGAEEAANRKELRDMTLFCACVCVICGVAISIPFHPVIVFCFGLAAWVYPRRPMLEKCRTAEERRKFYGLD